MRCITFGGVMLLSFIIVLIITIITIIVGLPMDIMGSLGGLIVLGIQIWWFVSMYKTVKGDCSAYNMDGKIFKKDN